MEQLDQSVMKTNQAIVMSVSFLSFVLGFVLQIKYAWVLLFLLGFSMILGIINSQFSIPKQLYLQILKPQGIVKSRIITDDPKPHNFAQIVGGSFLLLATLAFLSNLIFLGWTLAWVVIFLAFINFTFNFCVGCQMYFILLRLKVIS
jgi:hypothetical protein